MQIQKLYFILIKVKGDFKIVNGSSEDSFVCQCHYCPNYHPEIKQGAFSNVRNHASSISHSNRRNAANKVKIKDSKKQLKKQVPVIEDQLVSSDIEEIDDGSIDLMDSNQRKKKSLNFHRRL